MKFYSLTGNACDDKDMCTRGDSCSADGLCVGTLYECLPDCQACDGNNGCKTTKGCVTAGNCSCSINGQCYVHGAPNTNNMCQKCDIYSNANGWTDLADGAICDDGNACTRKDKCKAGTCGGDPFKCPKHPNCTESNVCNGDGCDIVYRPATYLCYENQDACDWPDQYCTGSTATCPQDILKPINGKNIDKGTVSVLNFDIQTATELLYTAAESGTFYRMMTQNKGIKAKFIGFTVPCDGVSFSWQLVEATDTQPSVTGVLTTTSGKIGTTEVSASNLNLDNGGVYKILLTAKNVRSDSQQVESQLILVDTTPPTFSGTINDGDAKVDIQYQAATTTLSAYWDPNDFVDPESGRDTNSFQIGAGLKAYETTVAGFTASKANEGVLNNLKLQHNTRYYITVSIANRAGLRGQAASNGVLVDTTPPVAGTVTVLNDEGGKLVYLAACSRQIEATIVNFKDDESGLDSFQWQICKHPLTSPLQLSCSQQGYVEFTCSPDNNCKLSVSHPQDRMVENGCFVNAYFYQLYIKAINRAGPFTEELSDKFTVDLEPPIAGVVNDGLAADINYQSNDQTLSANWQGFRDEVSGIDTCELAAFEEYGTADEKKIVDYLKVQASGQWTSDKLSLITGKTYYINVKCQDKAGLIREVTTDGVMVDAVAPQPGLILDTDDRNLDGDVDYQTSTTEVQTKWDAFTTASGLKSCTWALSSTSDPNKVGDVVGDQPVQLTGRNFDRKVQLTPYVKYFASIQCTSNAGLTSDVAFSDGITADNTNPVAGTVLDLCNDGCGSQDDVVYSADNTALRFRWTGFSDPHSGVVEYEWNYATCGTNFYIMQQFLSAGLNTTVLKTGLVLNHNERYCVTVRAINEAGGETISVGSGVLIDTTAPKGGIIHDGSSAGKDIDFQSNNRELWYTWDLIVDPESMIEDLTIKVGSLPGLEDVSPTQSISTTAVSYSIGALLLKHNRVYYGTVCATNKARVETCVRADGVLIDASPPDVGVVVDGVLQPDIDYQSNDHTIKAHWYGFKDVESNIHKFEWAIGTTPNGTDVIGFTEIGTNVTATETGLSLVNGKKYYVTVNAYNPGGHKVTKESDGVVVDTTAPSHQGKPTFKITGNSVLTASWKNFTDSESSIWFYKWAVGTTKCGTQIQAHTNVGPVANGKLTGASFIAGTTYYISVIARNRADLTDHICSDGLLFDDTPPKAGEVRDGSSDDIEYTSDDDSIAANWNDFVDPDSGISTCYFGVGTSTSKTDTQGFVDIKTVTSYTLKGLSLVQGVKYYVHVRCTNGVGMHNTTKTSNGVLVDVTAPVNGSVKTVKYQSSTTYVAATWGGFVDPDSGIESYWWAIGSRTPDSVDIQGLVDVGPRQSKRLTNLNLTAHLTYYVSVRAYNKAGLYTRRHSEGLTVDNSPPIAGNVQDGLGNQDIDWLTVRKGIGAKWSGFNDPHSQIDYYRWAVGTNAGGRQLQDYKKVNAIQDTCQGCEFTSGSSYFVTVEAVNEAGLTTTVSSDGFVVDLTPPDVSPVKVVKWQSVDFLAVEWLGARDAESGQLSCWVTIDDKREHVISTADSQTVLVDTARLQLGNQINCSVECVNEAGLSSTVSPVLVDASQPSKGTLTIFDQTEYSFIVEWTGFEEQESYIAYYEWDVVPCLNNTYTFSRVTQSDDFQVSYSVPEDSDEKCFTVYMRATNSFGLPSNVASIKVQLTSVDKPSEGSCCDINVRYTKNEIVATWDWKPGFERFASKATYRWAVGTEVGRSLVLSYTTTGTNQTGFCSSCSIVQGATYVITVQASVDNFETFISSQSDKIIIDFTEPECGIVQEGSEESDIKYYQLDDLYALHWGEGWGYGWCDHWKHITKRDPRNTKTSIVWNEFTDEESGVRTMIAEVIDNKKGGKKRSTDDLAIWNMTIQPATKNGTLKDIDLPWIAGHCYKSVVTCINGVGLSCQAESDGFCVDGTPPVVGVVNLHLRCTQSGQTLTTGSWTDYIDQESEIDYYEWSLYNITGQNNVTDFKNVGGNNTISKLLTLTHGDEYELRVKARNKAGLESVGKSSIVLYDITPPIPSYVYDGSKTQDVDYQSATTGIKAYWGSMDDQQTAIVRYEWAIGTQRGGEQTRPYENTGLTREGSCPTCILSSGVTYFVTVMAVNAAGLKATVSSDGILIDDTPPLPGIVFDGSLSGKDIDYQANTTSLSCSWERFRDEESPIIMYEYCFSSNVETCDLGSTKNVDLLAFRSTAHGFSLKHLSTYYAIVTATNGAGLEFSARSDGVVIDATPPTAGRVREGEQRDVDCIWINETLQLNWDEFYDDETDVVRYEFGVGSAPGFDNAVVFTSVGLNKTATCNLDWSTFQTVYATVTAYNEAGGRSTAWSDGVTVLSPHPGSIQPEECVSFGYVV